MTIRFVELMQRFRNDRSGSDATCTLTGLELLNVHPAWSLAETGATFSDDGRRAAYRVTASQGRPARGGPRN